MATYNIKLYAHGVPNGQDIWGNPGADIQYIEAFYGRRSSIPSQVFLEIMKFDGEIYSYYTYFRYGNFQEKEGRSGGYFALTLRVNYYYVDIQNIYNLLEASFNKYITGTVLEQTNSGYHFLVSQLKQADNTLNALEKEMEHYLMQFSSDTDFVSLNGFKSNGQTECKTINLLEAMPAVVSAHVKSTGKISVSPLHPTSRELQIIDKMNADIKDVQNRAKQEVQEANREKEKSIASIKNEYKDVDRTISELRTTIAEKEKKIDSSYNEIKKLNSKLKNAEDCQNKYKDAQSELKRTEKIRADLQRLLPVLMSFCDGNSAFANQTGDPYNSPEKQKNNSIFFNAVKKLHPFTDLFMILLLVIFVIPKSCSSSEDSEAAKELIAANNQIEELKQKLGEQKESSTETDTEFKTEESYNTLNEPYDVFAKAKIDIEGISSTSPMHVGKTYKVSLQNVDPHCLLGTWKSKDFQVSGDYIVPKHTGRCIIQYVIDDMVIKEREIDVQP